MIMPIRSLDVQQMFIKCLQVPGAVPSSGNAMTWDYKARVTDRASALMVRAVQSGKTDREQPLTYLQGDECLKVRGVGGLYKRKTWPYLKTSLSNCHLI